MIEINQYIPGIFSMLVFALIFIPLKYCIPKLIKDNKIFYIPLIGLIIGISLNGSSLISGILFTEFKNRHGRICLPPVGSSDSDGYQWALKSHLKCMAK